ncbi:MAG: cupredoxin domain-containing protein [Thermoleophilaceae bacterium]|nr:cupredoxin domain-containing protein [Thermoleophilaceae bacterium]
MKVDRPIGKALVGLGALLIVLSLVAIPFKGTDADKKESTASGGGATPSDKVMIKGFEYGPPNVAVKTGAKLTFLNQDSAKHTASDKMSDAFDTGTLQKGQSKTVTFDKPGTYAYICEFHVFMKGKVTVK